MDMDDTVAKKHIRRVQMRLEGIQTFARIPARSHWLHDCGEISVKP